MSLFKTDDTGDWKREGGGFSRVEGEDESLQHVTARLRLLQGEVFRDTRVGLRVFDFIENPAIDEQIAANHVAALILDTPGIVQAETQFDLEPESGELTVQWDGVFQGADLRERRVEHEQVLIKVGGSITES